MASTPREQRPLKPHNLCSKEQRQHILKPRAAMLVCEDMATYGDCLSFAGAAVVFGADSAGVFRVCERLQESIYFQLTFDPNESFWGELGAQIHSVQDASAKLGSRGFVHHFGTTPDCVIELAEALFRGRTVSVPKKGTINQEEAMLLFLIRLRHVCSTLEDIARVWGQKSEVSVILFVF
jgi:hypothetical protein